MDSALNSDDHEIPMIAEASVDRIQLFAVTTVQVVRAGFKRVSATS
jgi:hypothetical protein